jgi:hypothetical protein
MRALLLSVAGWFAVGGCAAIPDVTFAGDGGVDASPDTGADVSIEAAVDAPADVTADAPTSCPGRVPNYAISCCGEVACSGNDCTTTRCNTDCIPTCTSPAQPVCCVKKNMAGVTCISVTQARNQGCP